MQSDLGFRVSGKVLQRLVDTGQTVKRGQVLLRLDPIDLQLAAHAQREAVTAARARAQQASDDEARYRALRGTGAVSASAYDQYKAAADAARAQLSAAEAQAKVAGNATRYAELLADADGIVMETLAEPGQVVSAGQAVVRLAHAGPREALVQLPETLRPAVGSSAEAKLFGRQDVSVATRLRQLSDVADRQTRTFEARYVLEGELSDAPLGTTITVQISDPQTASPSTVQVPIAALYDAGNGPGIWMIRGEPTEVAWTPVNVQSLDDERPHQRRDRRATRSSPWARTCCTTAGRSPGRAGHRGGSRERPAMSESRFNLSALAVRERSVTLFLVCLISWRVSSPSSSWGVPKTRPSPSRS